MWYVVQVIGGRELATLQSITRTVSDTGLGRAFVPRRELMRHRDGEWVKTLEILFPGYVFIDTDDPDAVNAALTRISKFARLLGGDDGFTPVSHDERAVIEAMCSIASNHIAEMSEGVIEGGEVHILSGPLRGFDGTIMKIDRHKRAAYIRMPLLGREVNVKLGLEIIRKS